MNSEATMAPLQLFMLTENGIEQIRCQHRHVPHPPPTLAILETQQVNLGKPLNPQRQGQRVREVSKAGGVQSDTKQKKAI